MENHHLNIIVLFKWGWLPLLSNYQRWFRWVRSFPWDPMGSDGPRDKRQQVWQRPRLLASLLFLSLALAAKHVADRSSVDPSEWGISLQPYRYNQLASKITDWMQHLATTVVSCNVKILSMIAPVCVAKTTPSETMSVTSTQACCLQSWKRESSFQRNTWFCWEMEVPKMEDPKKKHWKYWSLFWWVSPNVFGVTQKIRKLRFSVCSALVPMVLQGCLHLGFPFFHALQMNLMQARLCRKNAWKQLEHPSDPSSYGNWSAICLGLGVQESQWHGRTRLPQLELDLVIAQWWGLKPMIKLLEFICLFYMDYMDYASNVQYGFKPFARFRHVWTSQSEPSWIVIVLHRSLLNNLQSSSNEGSAQT